MPYGSLYVHLVWATKNRVPVLIGSATEVAERSFRHTCKEHNAVVHAVYIMPDRVHIAVSIPAAVAVSTLVSRLNGSSSHLLKHAEEVRVPGFTWQAEYGALSLGHKQLPVVVRYIGEQQRRHDQQDLWAKLERWEPEMQPASAGFVGVERGFSPALTGDRGSKV